MGFQTILGIIIFVLWAILSILSMSEYIEYIPQLNRIEKFIFITVFIIGGPIFSINQVLWMILDNILPEGWDDDDDDFS